MFTRVDGRTGEHKDDDNDNNGGESIEGVLRGTGLVGGVAQVLHGHRHKAEGGESRHTGIMCQRTKQNHSHTHTHTHTHTHRRVNVQGFWLIDAEVEVAVGAPGPQRCVALVKCVHGECAVPSLTEDGPDIAQIGHAGGIATIAGRAVTWQH
jgi:hypothetical protein